MLTSLSEFIISPQPRAVIKIGTKVGVADIFRSVASRIKSNSKKANPIATIQIQE